MAHNAAANQNLSNSRYTDLIDEPVTRVLSPIKGYDSAPLIPLDQAVGTLSNLFDSIEENVWVARENSKNPADNLTQEESAAIHLYTMEFDPGPSLYQILNATLRSESRADLKAWFSYLKLFLTALYKLPSHAQTVWRGVRNVDLSSKYPKGTKFAWWGVSSCTTSVEVLQLDMFLGNKGVRTLFSIECRNGKSISPHSYFKDTEKEIILMPGTYLEVIGQLNPADDLYIIQLREIDPPFLFVKPPFKVEPSVANVVKPTATEPVTDSPKVIMTAPSKPLNVQVIRSTMTPKMQEFTIDIIRKVIAQECDEEDSKCMIIDELTRTYGGVWWVNISPKTSSHFCICCSKIIIKTP